MVLALDQRRRSIDGRNVAGGIPGSVRFDDKAP
jgi:hypothetical protein